MLHHYDKRLTPLDESDPAIERSTFFASDEGGASFRDGDDLIAHVLDGAGAKHEWFIIKGFFTEETV